MKKIILLSIIMILAVSVTACKKTDEPTAPEKFETGLIIDISEKNGQKVEVQPGDKIKLTLVGVNGEGYQWEALPPTSNIMTLVHHDTENNIPTNKGENFYNNFTFLIEKEGQTELKFKYDTPLYGDEPKETFEVTIISAKPVQ